MIQYTIRLRQGDAWLNLLNEKGETEQFSTRADAIIRGKALLEAGEAEEVRVWRNGEQARMWINRKGQLEVEAPL